MTKSNFRKILAVLYTICSIGYLTAITFLPVPTGNYDNSKIILGFILGTVVSTIINFYFGDSDQDKSDK